MAKSCDMGQNIYKIIIKILGYFGALQILSHWATDWSDTSLHLAQYC